MSNLFTRGDADVVTELGFVTANGPPAYYPFWEYGEPPGQSYIDTRAAVMQEAMEPFQRVSEQDRRELIDARILMMMRGAESMMVQAGDIWDAFCAETDAATAGIYLAHEDAGVQEQYQEWFEKLDAEYYINDAVLTASVYGNAYPVAIGDGDALSVVNLNPKRIAVGRQVAIGPRQVFWFGKPIFQKAEMPEWNVWPDIVDAGGLPLPLDRVYHVTPRKMHHERYGTPRVIRAWSDLTTRIILEEMVRATAEGVKQQVRLWRITDPRTGEARKLKQELVSNRTARVYDLVWDARLEVEQLLPGTVDALLAPDTWVRNTASIFRKLGMTMRLVSSNPIDAESNDAKYVEAEILIGMSRLQRTVGAQAKGVAKQIATWIATYGDPSLMAKGLPEPRVPPDPMRQGEDVRNVIVPLLNFGMMSTQTVHERLSLDHETEMERLKAEKPLRMDGTIAPYTGFAQAGPGGTVEHAQSQGRPRGADTNPNNRRTNQENAKQG